MEKLPELPELPKSEEPLLETEEKPVPEFKLPSVEEFPKPVEKEDFPKYLEPAISKPEEPEYAPEIEPYERFEGATSKEHFILKRKGTEPIFVKVGQFKGILTETSTIKKDLKIAEIKKYLLLKYKNQEKTYLQLIEENIDETYFLEDEISKSIKEMENKKVIIKKGTIEKELVLH